MRSLLVALAMLIPSAGNAQVLNVCAPYKEVLAEAEKRYQEKVKSFGLNGRGAVIELLVSKSGNFTIILVLPNKWTCKIASGTDWQDIKPLVGEPV